MADKMQIRAGYRAGMPTLTDREPGYVRDETALYIGTPDGNVKVGDARWETEKLSAQKVAAQAGVASDADAATIAAALNALIAAMKSSGVMNT